MSGSVHTHILSLHSVVREAKFKLLPPKFVIRWNAALHCCCSIVHKDCQRKERSAADNVVNDRCSPAESMECTQRIIDHLSKVLWTYGRADVTHFALLATIVALTRAWRKH
jgi:hypothetical protein